VIGPPVRCSCRAVGAGAAGLPYNPGMAGDVVPAHWRSVSKVSASQKGGWRNPMFADRLRLLRLTRRLSQAAVARALGVTPATISAYENRRQEPSLDKLVRLATFFDVTVDYLCGASNTPRRAPIPDWLIKIPWEIQVRFFEESELLVPVLQACIRVMEEGSLESVNALLDVLAGTRRRLQ